MSTAFLLWVMVLPKFIESIGLYRAERAQAQAAATNGSLPSAALRHLRISLRARSAAYLVSFLLLVWHVYSGVYYIYFLLTTGNVF